MKGNQIFIEELTRLTDEKSLFFGVGQINLVLRRSFGERIDSEDFKFLLKTFAKHYLTKKYGFNGFDDKKIHNLSMRKNVDILRNILRLVLLMCFIAGVQGFDCIDSTVSLWPFDEKETAGVLNFLIKAVKSKALSFDEYNRLAQNLEGLNYQLRLPELEIGSIISNIKGEILAFFISRNNCLTNFWFVHYLFFKDNKELADAFYNRIKAETLCESDSYIISQIKELRSLTEFYIKLLTGEFEERLKTAFIENVQDKINHLAKNGIPVTREIFDFVEYLKEHFRCYIRFTRQSVYIGCWMTLLNLKEKMCKKVKELMNTFRELCDKNPTYTPELENFGFEVYTKIVEIYVLGWIENLYKHLKSFSFENLHDLSICKKFIEKLENKNLQGITYEFDRYLEIPYLEGLRKDSLTFVRSLYELRKNYRSVWKISHILSSSLGTTYHGLIDFMFDD
ncbi:MAG: hypothetical protein QXL75_02395 [archaeon]